jgi:excisionase family DNA binding protein
MKVTSHHTPGPPVSGRDGKGPVRYPAPKPVDGQAVRAEHRGRYLTIVEAADLYPVFTPRLLRRLVQERRIAFSRAGRSIVLAESDIETYLERNRVEPPRWNFAG